MSDLPFECEVCGAGYYGEDAAETCCGFKTVIGRELR